MGHLEVFDVSIETPAMSVHKAMFQVVNDFQHLVLALSQVIFDIVIIFLSLLKI